MKIHECAQGSTEWHACRLSIPTASQFSRLVTKTGKPSAQAVGYAHELLAEELLGTPTDGASSGFMERGKEMEASAVGYYEFQRDVEVNRVGFVTLDDGTAGCSPDGLVGDKGGLEIKCEGAGAHVGHLLGVATQYHVQVQGCMWICEREWWDFMCYHPQLPAAIVRVQRDDKFIDDLAFAVVTLAATMATMREQLAAQGCVANMARCPQSAIRRDVCRCDSCAAWKAQRVA